MKTTIINKMMAVGLLSLALSTTISAQQNSTYDDPVKRSSTPYYKNAFGFRAGQTSGITYKHITMNNNAIEIIGGVFPYAVSLTALYEKYVPSGANGLQFYFGGGGHVVGGYRSYAYSTYDRENGRYYYRNYSSGPAIGVDGIMGIEYKIPRAPFAFSFDLKPNVEFVPGYTAYGSIDPGLGIKIAF